MSIQLADAISVNTSKPTDIRYTQENGQPWSSVSQVNSTIQEGSRFIGLTVLIQETGGQPTEYWWKDNKGNLGLVPKKISANASNGLTVATTPVTGTNVGDVILGGTLTQATTIANQGNNFCITGNGSVGIGQSSITEKLEVYGNIKLSDLSNNKVIFDKITLQCTTGNFGLDYLNVKSNTTNKGSSIFLVANGNPSSWGYDIHARANELNQNDFLIAGDNSSKQHNIGCYVKTGGEAWPLVFRMSAVNENWADGKELIVLTAPATAGTYGNVGIGKLNPQFRLDVSGSANFLMTGNTPSSPFGNKFSIRNGMVRIGINPDATNAARFIQFTNESDTAGSETFFIGVKKTDSPGFGEPIISMASKNALHINYGPASTTPPITLGNSVITFKKDGRIRYVPTTEPVDNLEYGDTYYDSSSNKLRVYTNTGWVNLH